MGRKGRAQATAFAAHQIARSLIDAADEASEVRGLAAVLKDRTERAEEHIADLAGGHTAHSVRLERLETYDEGLLKRIEVLELETVPAPPELLARLNTLTEGYDKLLLRLEKLELELAPPTGRTIDDDGPRTDGGGS